MTPKDVLDFWLAAGPLRWFSKDDAFDIAIRERFLEAHEAAARGDLDAWEESREGALALLILLDQFSRNLHRGSPSAFANDAKARAIASRALAQGFDAATPMPLRQFFYLPFMHSEEVSDQECCVALYRALGDEGLLKYADEHLDIVRRFGRFPHRNAVLGRQTTAEEQAFLDGGGFAG